MATVPPFFLGSCLSFVVYCTTRYHYRTKFLLICQHFFAGGEFLAVRIAFLSKRICENRTSYSTVDR